MAAKNTHGKSILEGVNKKQQSVRGKPMISASDKDRMLKRIGGNIRDHGRHIYSVTGGYSPRFLYTIGLYEKAGVELLFAGGAFVEAREIASVLNRAAVLIENGHEPSQLHLRCDHLGAMRLVQTDTSWASRLLLGALDYYDLPALPVWQLIPEDVEKSSIDIPNTAEPFREKADPAWRWLEQKCPHDIAQGSMAITDMDLLLGYGASEIMRWEVDEWEIYSGEKPTGEAGTYRVPLAPLLAFDASLLPALDLAVGRGLIRSFNQDGSAQPWQPWGPK